MANTKPKGCKVKEIKKFCDKVGEDNKKCEARKEKCKEGQ
jgi:hypothetical protein